MQFVYKYYIEIIFSKLKLSQIHTHYANISINFSTYSVRQILIKVYQYSYPRTAHSRKYLELDYT